MNIEKAIDLLGRRGRDRVTNFKGIITSLSFDLYGCIQVIVKPQVGEDGKSLDGAWFDLNRIVTGDSPKVMPTPDFFKGYVAKGNKGPESKSLPNN